MFIKNIIYINLDDRTDRFEEINNELFKLLKYSPFTIERYRAIKTDPGIIGCGYSHLNAIKMAKTNGYPYVWIIEDDFIFTETHKYVVNTLKELDSILNTEPINVIFLAYNLIEGQPYIGKDGLEIDNLIKTTNCQTASSYIVCANYYDTLINNLEEGLELLKSGNGVMHHLYANDQYWKSLQQRDNWVVLKKRLGKQRASYSDNSKCFMDYDV
jgi:GR25 family glycosyltransferase involved in LPS biosynthesis